MKESDFINQNKQKWKRFEQRLHRPKDNPDELAELFIEVTDDLSYARTFYPNRSIRYYLNTLAQRVFYRIHKNRKIEWKKIPKYWTEELPSVAWHSRKYLLFSFLIFLFAAIIGAFSSFHDPDFCEVIMGNDYVEMTKENISNGDPLAVYKKSKEVEMFLGITLNNIMVSIQAFLFGLVFGIGSIGILMMNGIMVGAFQYFFIKEGFGLLSFTTIWLHGTLEISAIIIAGAAGMILGRGLIFPGTYSRLQAFQISAKMGLKLLLGVLPIFIVAGFIEGFFTRYTHAPVSLKLLVIATSFLFITFYFVIYPNWRHRKGLIKPLKTDQLTPQLEPVIQLRKIKHVGLLISEGLQVLKSVFKRLFPRILTIAFIHASFLAILYYSNAESLREEGYNVDMNGLYHYHSSIGTALFVTNTLFLVFFLTFVYKSFFTHFKLPFILNYKGWSILFAVSICVNLSLFKGLFAFLFGLILIFGYLIITAFVFVRQKTFVERNLRDHLVAIMQNNHSKLLLVGLFGAVLLSLILAIFGTGLFHLFDLIIRWNTFQDYRLTEAFRLIFLDFISLSMLFMGMSWLIFSILLSYYSFQETNEANQLKLEIDEIF